MTLIYGIKYKHAGAKNWDWDNYGTGKLVKYTDINKAYKDYEGPKFYEWYVEEIPEDLLK